MRVFCCLMVIALVGFAAPASGEYYKYKDQNGVTRFTDNLADIPEDQRPKVKTYEESESSSAYIESAKDKRQDFKAADSKENRREQRASKARSGSKAEQMRQKRDALESKHAGLMKEKQALEAKRDTIRTAQEVRAYQNEVAQLNTRISAFEKRREAFKKEVDAFNKTQGN